MEFKGLTPEQQERAMACKTPEELAAFAKSEGMELTMEQLDAISGGWGCEEYVCDRVPHFS